MGNNFGISNVDFSTDGTGISAGQCVLQIVHGCANGIDFAIFNK
jgi:hypothetical protein